MSKFFSSARARVGVKFKHLDLESEKNICLEECRKNILDIGLKQCERDIENLKLEFRTFFLENQGLPPHIYI